MEVEQLLSIHVTYLSFEIFKINVSQFKINFFIWFKKHGFNNVRKWGLTREKIGGLIKCLEFTKTSMIVSKTGERWSKNKCIICSYEFRVIPEKHEHL